MFTRKSIMQSTFQVGGSTFISRLLGIVREFLTVRYMGASAISDAFFTAFKVPNMLRRIFAEGALSAAFVPTIVQTIKEDGKDTIGSMMTLGFLLFESMVLLLCFIIMLIAYPFVGFIAPGFSPEQIEQGAHFLRIVMPFLFLISSSALLAGPLQAVGHFFIPSFGPAMLNIVYICGLLICLHYSLPITTFCWIILLAGALQLLAHFWMYWRLGFTFSWIKKEDIYAFGPILSKFVLCLLSMSVMELGLFIDTSFGSWLSKGSVSLINYASRFMNIPLGVFAVAFSTILLPHFSRVSSYAPKRLGFYLLEASKLVWWVMIPVAGMMMLLSQKIFTTIFLSDKFSFAQAQEASTILIAFLCGLFFFSINKILSNVYYALHYTFIPGVIGAVSIAVNASLDYLLIDSLQAVGLAIATSFAGLLQTVFLFGVLQNRFELNLYFGNFIQFIGRHTIQLIVMSVPFFGLYFACHALIPQSAIFFLDSLGYWFWVGPLCMGYMVSLYATRSLFGVRLLFLEG